MKKQFWRNILIIAGSVILFIIILNLLFPLPEYKIEKDYSTVYLDRNNELLRISLSGSEKYRIKLSLGQVSSYVKNGLIAYEDKYFYIHTGFNPAALVKAFVRNLREGRAVSGASTISMQIARMIERKPRTYGAKIIELFRALQLEWKYSKDELLEIYINTIPMGGNIEGIGAGAYYYFNKNVSDLSLYEACVLIGIPNSPNRNRPDRNPENAGEQFRKVLSRIREETGIQDKEYNELLSRRIDVHPVDYPFRCPHLIETHKGDNDSHFVRYAIDLKLQSFCEYTLKKYTEDNGTHEIYNGAVIVADNRTHEVLAYVGSPDYFDDGHCGQINGAAIPRSPGSALKPFLYAKALEAGIITPEKTVYDIPISGKEYSPANYSKTSLGPVTAGYALIHSLNIPAVRLERQMNGSGLQAFLKEVFPLKQDILIEKSGLSLVLGGFHVSLENMVMIYMTLSQAGELNPLKFYIDETEAEFSSKKILDERSCYIISEMLSLCHRPDLPNNWEFTTDHAKAALKTGTSFGLKDAWCFGYNPDYTVGVWQGNSDNRGSNFLIGVERAAPLMIRIFNHITRGSDSWFAKPAGVSTREVCGVSGEKRGPLCGGRHKTDLYIPGVSSEQVCSVHKKITLRKKDNLQVCPYCMTGDKSLYYEKIVEYWPDEVISFLRKTGREHHEIPGHNPDCTHYFAKNKPDIISPGEGAVYEIDDYVPLESQKIPLKAFVAHDAGTDIFWFIGDDLIQKSSADETCFLTPRRGEWIISAVDSRGRSDYVKITVY